MLDQAVLSASLILQSTPEIDNSDFRYATSSLIVRELVCDYQGLTFFRRSVWHA